jgi:hypothetical protein
MGAYMDLSVRRTQVAPDDIYKGAFITYVLLDEFYVFYVGHVDKSGLYETLFH